MQQKYANHIHNNTLRTVPQATEYSTGSSKTECKVNSPANEAIHGLPESHLFSQLRSTTFRFHVQYILWTKQLNNLLHKKNLTIQMILDLCKTIFIYFFCDFYLHELGKCTFQLKWIP